MKTCVKFLFLLLAAAATACSVAGDPLPAADPRCDYPIYTPPRYVRYGNTICPNPCRFVYEGEVSFAEGWLEINCRRFPTDLPRMKWSVDTSVARDSRGNPLPVIRIQSKGFAAWCRRDLIFEQAGCPLKAEDAMFAEYGRSDGRGDGDVTIVMDQAFWACYTPSDPFYFRLTTSLPLDLDGLDRPLAQGR